MNARISTDKSELDIAFIHAFLSASYWSESIPIDVLSEAIENSLCFGAYVDERQIGFARAVTDYATFAYVADVFVVEELQGRGYGKQLMEYIMQYPALQGIKRWHIITKDAQPLYSKFGFSAVAKPEQHMEIRVADIYKKL